MSIVTTAIMTGIGATRVVETIKEALPQIPPPAIKSTFASALAGAAGAALTRGGWRTRALAGLGAIGVAMLTHETRSLLSLFGDRQKTYVVRAANGR